MLKENAEKILFPEYHKIDCPYVRCKREPDVPKDLWGRLKKGIFRHPEDICLLHNSHFMWRVKEKIDGRNTRIYFRKDEHSECWITSFNGRTENSAFSKFEMNVIKKKTKVIYENILKSGDFPLKEFVVFGELFGEKIQKNPYQMKGQHFLVFDILYYSSKFKNWYFSNDEELDKFNHTAFYDDEEEELHLWHERNIGTFDEVERSVMSERRFGSIINKGVEAEGLVISPPYPLYSAGGRRIIYKVKRRDYQRIVD